MLTTKPRFKYLIVLKAAQPEPYQNNNNNNYKRPPATVPGEQIVCLSDGFEIKEDGSIVFYQVVRMSGKDDKQVKIPVLAYPNGKWENCLLVNQDNSFAAFNADNTLDISSSGYHTNNNPQTHYQEPQSHNTGSGGYGGQAVRPANPSPFNGQQDSFQPPSNPVFRTSADDFSVPGFSNQQAPDYQKLKREYTEAELRKYLSDNSKFTVAEFQKHLEIAAKTRPTNPKIVLSENDIQFNIAFLLKKNVFAPHKFMEAKPKHILDMYLPPILKRQWEGKTSTIMETLQTSNETQTITQIDLAAWLAIKGYFKK